jgi:hypothetical protein
MTYLATYLTGITGTELTEVRAGIIAVAADTDGTLAANSDLVVPTQKAVKTYVDAKSTLLASTSGLGLVGFIQSGTGAVARTAEAKAREIISVEDFGAVGDGSTNDAAALNTSGTSATGKAVALNNKYNLTSTVSIPAETTFAGQTNDPEQVVVGTGSYYNRQSALKSSASTALSVGRGASLERVTLTRSGLTMPWSTNAQVTANIAAFGGTGVDVSETGATVANAMLLGFTTGITGTFASDEGRARIMFNKFDCTNGISLTGARDLNIIGFNHAWPFLSAHTTGVTDANLKRAGAFLTFGGSFNEASLSIGNFEYGYAVGIAAVGPNLTSAFDSFDDIDGANKTAYSITGEGYFQAWGGSAIVCTDGAVINSSSSNVPAFRSFGKWYQASRYVFDHTNGDFSSVGDVIEGRGGPNVSVGYNVRVNSDNFAIVAPQTGNLNEVLKIASGWSGYGFFMPGMNYSANTTWVTAAQAELNRVTILNANPANGLTNQMLRPLRINMAATPEIELYRADGAANQKRASVFYNGTSLIIRLKNDADNATLLVAAEFDMVTGRIKFPTLPGSTSYANDAAAAAGGVAVGELYRNGSVVQVRVT